MPIATSLTEDQADDVNHFLMTRYGPDTKFGFVSLRLKNGEIVLALMPLIMENGVIYIKWHIFRIMSSLKIKNFSFNLQ